MKLKLVLLLILVLILYSCCALGSQPPETEWSKTFGGSDNNQGFSVQQTSDGGFIITGETGSQGFGSGDVWLIKTDSLGKEEWSKTFGGSDWELGKSVQQTSDGGFIIIGSTDSGSADVWLIKTDAQGNEMWNRTFGGYYDDWGVSVQQSSDGGYILVGESESRGDTSRDIWLIKTDSLGKEVWSKTFGGSGEQYANSAQQANDGGYILVGESESLGDLGRDIWLIKTDSLGKEEWSKTFGGSDDDRGKSIQQTSDGGYIIAGSTLSYSASKVDIWLIKTDSAGNELWNKTFGGSDNDMGFSVQQTSDGGFIITGTTNSYGAGSYDVWLIKTNSQGNEEWSKTFGGSDNDQGFSVKQTSDGGFIITGKTQSYGTGDDDAWLIKVKGSFEKQEEVAVPTGYATIYLTNLDDDQLYINGKIDDKNIGAMEVLSGSSDLLFGKFEVTPGSHTFQIRWEDSDTGERYENETSKNISPGENIVTLTANRHLPTTGTAKVYVKDLDDDDLYVDLFVEEDRKDQKLIPSGSSKYEFGSYELSPGSYDFKISWTDPDTDESYETKSSVSINADSTSEVSLTIGEHLPPTGTAKVYVNNQDDDDLDIELWLDDQLIGSKQVPAGSSRISFGDYDLTPGDHDFKIRWTDPDIDESNDTIITQLIGIGKSTEVTLTAERYETSTAVVNIKNKDDDEIFVMLYIDDELRNKTSLSHWTQHVESFTLPSGTHEFRIEWRDQDTDEEYNVSVTQSFDPGVTLKVNLEVEEHLATTARVYVNNEYFQDIPIKLLIEPYGIVAQETVPAGHSDLGEHILDPGEHAFSLIWTDPCSGNEYQFKSNETLSSGQVTTVKMKLVRPLEVELYPQSLDIYEDETAHVFLDLWNGGSSPSRNVVATVEMDDPSILEVEPTYRIGDVQPKDGGTWPIYLKGLEEGHGQLKIAVKGDDLKEVVEYVSVKVAEPPKATRLVADQGAVKVETFEETAEEREDDLKSSLLREVDDTQFTSTVLGDGIEVKLDVYGDDGGSYVDVGEPVYMKFYVKNTGKMGMWIQVVPLEPNLDYEWKGDALAHVPNRWRVPVFDEGVVSPYKEFNSLYYQVKTGLDGTRSVEGLAYVVPGETLEVTLKCIPKEEGRLVLGGTVYHTNSQAMNQLTLTDENGREFLIHYDSFENKYGHKDESFLAQDLKDYNKHFGIISVQPWEITSQRWVKLETLKEEMVQKEIEVKMKKTFGQRASEAITSIFSWGGS